MDERIEYQLRWLEESVNRVMAEAKTLASMVDKGKDLLDDVLNTAAALHMHLEAVKGKLTPKLEVIGTVETQREISYDEVAENPEAFYTDEVEKILVEDKSLPPPKRPRKKRVVEEKVEGPE